jgi:hypothetical protein
MSHEPTTEPSRCPDSTSPDPSSTAPWRATDAGPDRPQPAALPRAGFPQVDVPDASLPESPNEYPWSGWRPDEEVEEPDELPDKSA